MINVENLSYTYTGTTNPAVRGLSFAVQPGEIFGFLGPSGAGKSTTQKVLIRLLQGFEGNITLLGKDLRAWGYDLYEQIGISFEFPNHYSKLTAIENLKYFGALYANPVLDPQKLLEMVGLEEDGNLLVSQFSKGMKNRLNVARALVHQPKLLFLDEPTSGLDPVNRARIKQLILDQKAAGSTVFLTTHDMSVADELCDRVAFIVDGTISRIDSPRALKLQFGRPEVRVEYNMDGETKVQDFPMQGLADNPDFQNILRSNSIQTMHSQEASLENIFIQVTGRSLE